MKRLQIPDSHYTISQIRVRYAETDAMRIAHHSAYLPWFEIGRTDLGHKIGAPYKEIEKRNIYYPLTEVYCQFKYSAAYDDQLNIKSWMRDVKSRMFSFYYEISNAQSGMFLASGYTKHIVIDHHGSICKLPDDLFRLYQKFDVNLL